jgi:hypothetical protein
MLSEYGAPEVILHLETFINFVEAEIKPRWDYYANIDKLDLCFDELCMAIN